MWELFEASEYLESYVTRVSPAYSVFVSKTRFDTHWKYRIYMGTSLFKQEPEPEFETPDTAKEAGLKKLIEICQDTITLIEKQLNTTE